MRYGPNRGIYDSIEEFIDEYSPVYNMNGENSRGMDFIYKNEKYRICREERNTFYVYKGEDFEILGIAENLEELLVSKFIDNKEFKEIVMDEENTFIYGKD